MLGINFMFNELREFFFQIITNARQRLFTRRIQSNSHCLTLSHFLRKQTNQSLHKIHKQEQDHNSFAFPFP
ncbi:hypothetical protein OIU74_021462 [Salix koriyanagi]|uniref:Uncharacterized protein n=1 Tax=Salix koriyanagi TaxID=2511006 RepID=A0A9Q0WHY9_9ROSI|nr:hypothetical protein OIU74_021462 [Salix koriyanagi]